MSLTLPTTKELADQIISDLESTLGQTIPFLPKAVFRVMAFAFAAVFILLYKFGGWQFEQMFVSTADDEALERWGKLVGIIRDPGVQNKSNVEFSGSNGEIILTGTRFSYLSTGFIYTLDSDVTIVAGVGSGVVTSISIGIEGNLLPGQILNFVTPQPNVLRQVEILSTAQIGTNIEPLPLYRTRVSNRYRKVPQGGAYADYEAWSLEVATIDGAFPYSGDQEGTVVVYIRSSATPTGFPTATEINEVVDSINQPDRRPVTADVFVTGVLIVGFVVTVENLTPDNTGNRDVIFESLENYFKSREPFIDGLSIQNNGGITLAEVISVIQGAVSAVSASFDSASLALASDPLTPITRYTLLQGQVSSLTSIAYV